MIKQLIYPCCKKTVCMPVCTNSVSLALFVEFRFHNKVKDVIKLKVVCFRKTTEREDSKKLYLPIYIIVNCGNSQVTGNITL